MSRLSVSQANVLSVTSAKSISLRGVNPWQCLFLIVARLDQMTRISPFAPPGRLEPLREPVFDQIPVWREKNRNSPPVN
jgi:hypothetical protein